MELQKVDSGAVQVSDEAFGSAYNEALVHQVVTAYMAGGRRGTKAQRNRSAARGGGAKPWRQKGTGRARAGTIRSPIWVGGGRTFAATPRKFKQKINRKMYQGAMRALVSELARDGRLVVADEIGIDVPKTRMLVDKLKSFDLDSVLILVEAFDESLYLASRNLPNVDVMEVGAIDPVSLLRYEKVLLTVAAVKRLEEKLV